MGTIVCLRRKEEREMVRTGSGLLATLLVALLLLALGLSLPAHAVLLYENDFESSIGTGWTTTGPNPLGIDVTPSGRHFLGEINSQFPNFGFSTETVTLTLGNLIPHTAVTLSFDLYVIQSWDGNGESDPPFGQWGIDIFNLNANHGAPLLHTTFRNVPFPSQSFPGTYTGNYATTPHNAPRTGAAENNTLGYPLDFPHFGDAVYHFVFPLSNSESTLQVNFSGIGLQEIWDESWGLDNVRVDVVPEPSTILLLMAGFVALLVTSRRHLSGSQVLGPRR